MRTIDENTDLKRDALGHHEQPRAGKVSVTPTKPLANQRDLVPACSPGVGGAALVLRMLGALLLVAAVAFGATACAREQAPPSPRAAPLAEVASDALPEQARQTLVLIRQGGPFPYRKDGSVFNNRERLLPKQPRGYYTEYTVPTPGSRDRGARRIVAGRGATGDPATSGEYYYTDDHYQSFRRIRP